MKNLYEKDGKYEVMAGSYINSTVAEGVGLAGEEGQEVQFEFNGVTVTVRDDSDAQLILRDFHRAIRGYIEGDVGPYPAAVLTDEEKAHDAEVMEENNRK